MSKGIVNQQRLKYDYWKPLFLFVYWIYKMVLFHSTSFFQKWDIYVGSRLVWFFISAIFKIKTHITLHCSYLNIYISRKLRLCVIDLEGQFQFQFQNTVDAIPKRLNLLSYIFASNCNWSISTLWNSINSVQKAVDLTTPAKYRRKMRIIDLNFSICKSHH